VPHLLYLTLHRLFRPTLHHLLYLTLHLISMKFHHTTGTTTTNHRLPRLPRLRVPRPLPRLGSGNKSRCQAQLERNRKAAETEGGWTITISHVQNELL
jgi:hypothetical protein